MPSNSRRGKPLNDLKGQKFGRLTVLGFVEIRSIGKDKRVSTWRCVCECGKYKTVIGSSLVAGNTRSCGCLQKEISRDRAATVARVKGRLTRRDAEA